MEHVAHFAQSFTVEIVAVLCGGALHHAVVRVRAIHKKRCLLCRRPHTMHSKPHSRDGAQSRPAEKTESTNVET